MSSESQGKPCRLLLLADRQADADVVSVARSKAEGQLAKLLPAGFEIKTSEEWFNESFDRSGDWSTWAWETVHGIRYADRQPHFSGFVVCQYTLGKVNADIVQTALKAKKPVLFCKDFTGVVESVVTEDSEDWKSGWSLEVAPFAINGEAR